LTSTQESLSKCAAVRVRVNGDDAVISSARKRHAEERRDGRLSNSTFPGQDGHEPWATTQTSSNAQVNSVSVTNRSGITAVNQPECCLV
jgi:hypothetical protein